MWSQPRYTSPIRRVTGRIRTCSSGHRVRIWPDSALPPRRSLLLYPAPRPGGEITVLVKVFPIKLKDGMQDTLEAIGQAFPPKGPGPEDATLSFRAPRDPPNPASL